MRIQNEESKSPKMNQNIPLKERSADMRSVISAKGPSLALQCVERRDHLAHS